jgi:hypothetical protein
LKFQQVNFTKERENMLGARRYHNLIEQAVYLNLGELRKINCSGYGQGYQYKNIVFVLGEHARGKTFQIWIYKDNDISSALTDEHIEVYDVISGQRGWTEIYGWTVDGAWKDYIEKYFDNLTEQITEKANEQELLRKQAEDEENKKLKSKIDEFNQIFLNQL